jgi:hypothetical protein
MAWTYSCPICNRRNHLGYSLAFPDGLVAHANDISRVSAADYFYVSVDKIILPSFLEPFCLNASTNNFTAFLPLSEAAPEPATKADRGERDLDRVRRCR